MDKVEPSVYLKRHLDSAVDRCRLVSENERLLGYQDYADLYAQMAGEIGELLQWVRTVLAAHEI